MSSRLRGESGLFFRILGIVFLCYEAMYKARVQARKQDISEEIYRDYRQGQKKNDGSGPDGKDSVPICGGRQVLAEGEGAYQRLVAKLAR